MFVCVIFEMAIVVLIENVLFSFELCTDKMMFDFLTKSKSQKSLHRIRFPSLCFGITC